MEINSGVFRNAVSRLKNENTGESSSLLVRMASFMPNMFHGDRTMSAFQLARVYAPSIAGLPASMVTAELLDVHVHTSAARAVQRFMNGKNGDSGMIPGMWTK